MKIERIDDKTVKCFLSNEELEEYDIDYKDFVTRSDKAKEVVQEIIEQAEEEVGYKPPKYAFDLQIMMLPDEGLVLVFSEKEPLENKNGAQLLQALQEMKRVFEEKKAEIGATLGKQAKEETENNAGKNKKAKGKAEEAAKPQFAIFAFRNIGRVIEYAAVLPANLRINSTLYRMEDGTCYSLEGSIQRVANNIFIIAPENVDISGDFKEELKTKGVLLPWMNGTNAR